MMNLQNSLSPAELALAAAIQQRDGLAGLRRWLAQRATREATYGNTAPPMGSTTALLSPHESHRRATALLAAEREALGPAYEVIHLLARWSIEHASEDDPAPHLFTTYWTLEEALGKCERTLRRHLAEDGWPWSDTVRKYVDVRVNYGTYRHWNKETDIDEDITRPVGLVIRPFLKGRWSENACVKRFAKRDLMADADRGLTKNSRPHWIQEDLAKDRYQRGKPRMSAHTPLREQITERCWLMVQLGRLTAPKVKDFKEPQGFGKLCADIPTSYLLDALREDLRISENHAIDRGAAVPRARSLWVDRAARVLAERFDEHRPRIRHLSDRHITHADGFTSLWRRILWTALNAECYGDTERGWMLMQHMVEIAGEARELNKPMAYAWVKIKPRMEALRRDFGSGAHEGSSNFLLRGLYNKARTDCLC